MRDLFARYVFVDPGVHQSGIAYFFMHELTACTLREAAYPLCKDFFPGPTKAVCEKPKMYDEEAQARMGRKIRSSDIEDLLLAAGSMCSGLDTTYLYPSQWKGSRKKEIMHDRLDGLLSPAERSTMTSNLAYVKEPLQHNVKDAICLGLVYLGRWK